MNDPQQASHGPTVPEAGEPARGETSARRTALAKALLLVVALIVFTIAALVLPIPSVDQMRDLVAEAGWWGPIGFGAAYAALTLAPVPKNILSVGAGVLVGFGPGLLIVYAAAMVGASAAFWLGRALGREAVERFTGTRVARVEDALVRHGFAAVVGVRLVPVLPFTAINYSAGLTALGWWPYFLGTLLGIIPGTASFLALGAFGFQPGAQMELAFAVLGLLTLAGIAYAVRLRGRNGQADV
ncbi:TVP38/TMEM64 family protein [Nesterenkonia sp. Act20]|uniref:TVP38/TMEM64 family protein n=1 Tax=Nesterenkonia sp. Act20 TaxID=1483432 RepID=UPI001C483976